MNQPFLKKLITYTFVINLIAVSANAQTKAQEKIDSVKFNRSNNEQTEKFKKNDSAYRELTAKKTIAAYKTDSTDLKLKFCEFEKNANAEVLKDQATVAFGPQQIIMQRLKRIKIFNDNGKGQANIRIEYNNRFGAEHILAVVAETMNFNNGKIEHTKLDSSLVYNIHTDKQKDAIVFTMPNVKAGSVIEYAYLWSRVASRNFPDWNFQCELPTRYSEVNILLNPQLTFTQLTTTDQPFVKDTISFNGYGHAWGMKNIPSSKNEPFMRSASDNLQKISLVLKSVTNNYGQTLNIADSWITLGKQIGDDKLLFKPFDQNISEVGDLLKKARAFKTEDQKIEFIFNSIKSQMKWNQEKNWMSKDGIKTAWKNKTGNWGEINMILYHLLQQAGINAYPMLVSTRDNGLMYSNFPNFYQINKLVVYIPVDSDKYYILDAAEKFNLYNEVPFEILNSNGLWLDRETGKYGLLVMKEDQPVKQTIGIEAEIKPDGSMAGSANIYDYGYNKSANMELYKTLDEKKYDEYLTDNDYNLKIISLKQDNADVDSLPLTQQIEFKLDLSADEKYIYFSPNLFTSLRNNPFISTTRTSNIDFGYKNTVTLRAVYKLPAGYKIDYLPKSTSVVTADKTIIFKRVLQVDNSMLIAQYTVSYQKSVFSKDEYPNLFIYFKKMYELLNEQIVLKKI